MAYEKSAEFYDAIYSWKKYDQEVEMLSGLAAERGIDQGAWLDVACGTGKHLSHVPARFQTEGVELDPDMHAIAAKRLPDSRIHLGDMRSFRLERQFEVITCLFSSIGYMTEPEDLDAAVANMALHLRTVGVLFIEPWFMPQQFFDGHVGMDSHDGERLKIARIGRSWTEGPISCMEMHHLVGTPDGVQYFTEVHRLGLYTDHEYRAAFERCGVSVERRDPGPTGRGLYVGRKG